MKPCSPTRWVMLMVFSNLLFAFQLRAEGIGMVTGTATGAYIQFGPDIAKVAQSAGAEGPTLWTHDQRYPFYPTDPSGYKAITDILKGRGQPR